MRLLNPFLAQFLRVAVVRLDVDRPFEEEGLVQTVQLVLDRLRCSLSVRKLLSTTRKGAALMQRASIPSRAQRREKFANLVSTDEHSC
jgi:hypothetical protein